MLRGAAWLLALVPAASAGAMKGGDEGGTVSQLTALAQLHAAGSLTDAEFSQAKRRVLEVPPAPPPLVAINASQWAAEGKRMMVITAHPDDAEFFAGGLVAAFTSAGGNASYLVMTNGDGGGECYDSPALKTVGSCESEELALIRRREMLAAGRVLNVSNVWRGDLEDGMTVSYHETMMREKITAYVRHFQPHIVVTHWPEPNWRAPPTCNGDCIPSSTTSNWDDSGYHPDHKRVGLMAFNALYQGGSSVDNAKLFKELQQAGGLEQWKVEQLYMFALTRDQPITHYLPLDERLMALKSKALAAHHSQYPGAPTMNTRWRVERVGKEVGQPLAEGYLGWW